MNHSMRTAIVAVAVLTGLAGAVWAADEGGRIKGVVKFEGELPRALPPLKDIPEPHCKKMHPEGIDRQPVKVKDGKLANVFVHIKESSLPKDTKWEVPKNEKGEPQEVVLDQKGCEYHPHVLGLMVGQPLKVINSDPVNHNVHGFPRQNRPFNFSQARKGMEKVVELTKPERFVIKCDVHAWMSAHVFVMTHPFFAVTDEEGKFEIKNVPPGTYELEYWHETLGTKTVKGVKVEAGQEVTAEDVAFTAKKTPARN